MAYINFKISSIVDDDAYLRKYNKKDFTITIDEADLTILSNITQLSDKFKNDLEQLETVFDNVNDFVVFDFDDQAVVCDNKETKVKG